MRKFILNILFFSFIIISMFSFIAIIVDKGLRRTEFENYKEWNDIFNKKTSRDILIQGSSRAHRQFNTYILDSVLNADSYNFGMGGTPFTVQYIRFKAWEMNNPSPKLILQNVDWDVLSKDVAVYQKNQFMPYLNDSAFRELIIHESILPKTDIYLSFLKYSGQTKALQIGFLEFFGLKHFAAEGYKGYSGVNSTWNGVNFEKRKKEGKIKWKRNKEVEKLFIDFMKYCKQNKIKVVLVHSPLYHELKSIIVDQDDLLIYFRNLAKEYDADFLDYSNDSLTFDKNNFYDATHLNKNGSELFTLKLAKKLKEMKVLDE